MTRMERFLLPFRLSNHPLVTQSRMAAALEESLGKYKGSLTAHALSAI